ncbi:MAG: hypothetical protein NVS3B25_11710 [Hymenobacter sp.]
MWQAPSAGPPRMKPLPFADLLKRYLHDDCTTGEAWTVEQWYEARDLRRPVPPTPAEQAATKARAWRRVQARTRPRPTLWAQAWTMGRAAAAVLVLGAGLIWAGASWPGGAARQPQVVTARRLGFQLQAEGGWLTCTNATAHPVPLALADGSTVSLAPGSRLRYPQHFDGPERVVSLQGEGFFQVFHDARHPFRVLTDKLETTVLGTSFTVRAFADQPEATVMVRTGRVRVAPRAAEDGGSAPGPGLVLLPNQQAVYSPAAPELRPELVDQPALLQPQLLTFDQRPVAEVLATLQAGYGVPIRYDGAALANCTVSLAFTTESLFEKLDLLCRTLDASYERDGEAIIFRSRGCLSE